MKILFLDCGMGAAGDMLMGALLDLVEDKETFVHQMNHIGIPHVTVSRKMDEKCGIGGTHVTVLIGDEEEHSHDVHEHGEHVHAVEEHVHEQHDHVHTHQHDHVHTHHHASMDDIEHIISHMNVSDRVKTDVLAVYKKIAEAESRVHGKPVSEVHFHEVGMMDALADITGCALLMEQLNVDQVVVSPVNVGFGKVRCAHGILPVPAPATACILEGLPCYAGRFEGEMCTPTGAALLAHFADSFGQMPLMRVTTSGYGTGNKNFDAANVVRAILGTTENGAEDVLELCCNLDDMTAEEIGFAMEVLMEQGALDVYTTAIGMKKSRPGVLLTTICREADEEALSMLIFQHTTTIGIRTRRCSRRVLDRKVETVQTKYGDIRVKEVTGYGVTRRKAEYEDVHAAAVSAGVSLANVKAEIK